MKLGIRALAGALLAAGGLTGSLLAPSPVSAAARATSVPNGYSNYIPREEEIWVSGGQVNAMFGVGCRGGPDGPAPTAVPAIQIHACLVTGPRTECASEKWKDVQFGNLGVLTAPCGPGEPQTIWAAKANVGGGVVQMLGGVGIRHPTAAQLAPAPSTCTDRF